MYFFENTFLVEGMLENFFRFSNEGERYANER